MKLAPGGFPDIPRPICDACEREVDRVRGSMWHGDARICPECFIEWYDPSRKDIEDMSPEAIGNYVRSKHGLPPLTETEAP